MRFALQPWPEPVYSATMPRQGWPTRNRHNNWVYARRGPYREWGLEPEAALGLAQVTPEEIREQVRDALFSEKDNLVPFTPDPQWCIDQA